MKVAFYTPWNKKCGIADYAYFLVQALKKKGVAVEIIPVTDSKSFAGFVDDGRKINNADLAHLQHEYSFFSNSRLAVIYPLMSAWHFYLLQKNIKITKMVTLHELPSWTGRNPFLRFLGFLFIKTYAILLNHFDLTIVHAGRFRDILVRHGMDADRIIFIPHPFPVPKVRHTMPDEDVQAFKRSLSIKDKTVLTIFGFVHPRKGYEVVLPAIKELKNCILLIAGGPQPDDRSGYVEQLLGNIKVLGLEERIKMLGFLPEADIHKVMESTDIFLAPYLDAPGSGSLSRIAVYRKPIVASDISTMRELEELGLGVKLFKSGDSGDLCVKMHHLLNDKGEQRHLVELTIKFVEHHSYDRFAEDLKSLYERKVRK